MVMDGWNMCIFMFIPVMLYTRASLVFFGCCNTCAYLGRLGSILCPVPPVLCVDCGNWFKRVLEIRRELRTWTIGDLLSSLWVKLNGVALNGCCKQINWSLVEECYMSFAVHRRATSNGWGSLYLWWHNVLVVHHIIVRCSLPGVAVNPGNTLVWKFSSGCAFYRSRWSIRPIITQ